MKTCLRLTFFVYLLLPFSATANDTVSIPNPYCFEGNAFTIVVPFRMPPDIDSVHYRWYCNGELIPDAAGAATADNRSISYTVPADSAYGNSLAFHFAYRFDDGCTEWTNSPAYVVSFLPSQDCNLDVGNITIEYCGFNVGGVTIEYCGLNVGNVTIEYCELGVGGIEIERCGLVVGNITIERCGLGVGSIAIEYCGLGAGGIEVERCELGAGNITVEYCGLGIGSIAIEQCELGVGNIAVEQCEFNVGSIEVEYCELDVGSIVVDV